FMRVLLGSLGVLVAGEPPALRWAVPGEYQRPMRASKALVALVCFGVAIGSLSLALASSMPREATTAATLTHELAHVHADPASLAAFASTLKAQPVALSPAQSAALAA